MGGQGGSGGSSTEGRRPKVVEIRVHGVGGTPPESTLADPHPRPVGGDDTAQFLRRTSPMSMPGAPDRVVEAFHWGRMTAGSPGNALWLLLAPFAILNLARYTLPMKVDAEGNGTGKGLRRLADGILRLLGLALTLLLTATVAFVAIDLIAWQCGGEAACVMSNGWLPFADSGTTPYGWRLLAGVLAPSAVLGVLWIFGRQVHLYAPGRTDEPSAPPAWENEVGALGERWFWDTSPKAPVLRLLHSMAAAALLAGLVGFSTLDALALQIGAWRHAGLGLLALLLGIALGLTAVGWQPRKPERDPSGRDAIKLPRPLIMWRWITVGVLAAVVGWACAVAGEPVGGASRNLPHFESVFNVLYVALALLIFALAVTTLLLRRVTEVMAATAAPAFAPFRPLWRGMACPVIATIACLLATGFTSGAAAQVKRLLEPAALTLPDVHRVNIALWGVLTGLAILAGLVAGVRALFRAVVGAAQRMSLAYSIRIRQDYPGDVNNRTVRKIANAWRVASVKFKLPGVLLAIALLGALVLSLSALSALNLAFRLVDFTAQAIPGRLAAVGSWTVTTIAAGLAFLGSRVFNSPDWRRRVGVLWDLLSFWPRLAHPMCPPPYGGRAVLALVDRVHQVRDCDKADAVILSGHSQGSLICVAAVLVLARESKDEVRGLGLLTHGSQLMWAFPRLFPAYVGLDALTQVFIGHLDRRWYNLHRWTDPLGSLVLAWPSSGRVSPLPTPGQGWQTLERGVPLASQSSDPWYRLIGHEVELRDPTTVTFSCHEPLAPLRGHSDYYADPAYEVILHCLVKEIVAA